MHCNHLPSPGLCKVFELGIDRANEVELLFAPPAFELFFPSDGCANVFPNPLNRAGLHDKSVGALRSEADLLIFIDFGST